jgi:signal transduction histidine kinase
MNIYLSALQPLSLKLILILRRTILLVLLGITSIVSAQKIDPEAYTDISRITIVDTISNKIASAYISKDSSVRKYFRNVQYKPRVIHPERELSGDKRRNIFLCVKESLNNVVKHSKATRVRIEILTNHELIIRIVDDGVGINLNHIRQFGNGLQNISRRMKSIGGIFKIENHQGTTTTLILPI